MKQKISTFLSWLQKHRLATLLIVSAVVIAAAGNIAMALLGEPMKKIIPDIVVSKPKPKLYNAPLTGLPITNEADRQKPVTAIMIENSPDARPQSGLKDAEVVYEAIAEGGITRFVALYQQNKPQLIGPVRSIRPYYLDWIVPFNASIAHVGGSAAALTEVRNGNYRDIDQFSNGGTYWRTSDRFAPHNVYTSFEKLDALNLSKGFTSSIPKEFARTDLKLNKTPDATSINVHISSPTFDSSYTYDPKAKQYTRSQAGAPHDDREKGVITPKVVIIMNVAMSSEFQDTTREIVQTTGSGEVTIFQGGTVIKGTWNRATRDDQFNFMDSSGKEVKLDRGQTWITAIPNGSGSVAWQ